MNGKADRAVPFLDYTLLFFYAALVFLWFKDSIEPLEKYHVSCLIPLIGLVITGALRLRPILKKRGFRLNLRPNAATLAVSLLIVLAVVIRIPYLAQAGGLTNSDDAIPVLMGKHISEGKLPPVYFYGQLYLGSLGAHFCALMFAVFGYSFLLAKISALLLFLAFLAVQFVFMKEIFSSRFALAATLFFCLPIGRTVHLSLDNSRADSLVLLLGVSLLYLGYLIYFRSRENLLPLFGFVAGIAFWSHQILIFSMLTALVLVILKMGMRWKKYFLLGLYFAAGVLPVLMMEVHMKIPLVRYLLGGEAGSGGGGKLKRTGHLTLSLIAPEKSPVRYVLLLFLILGFVRLLVPGIRKRRLTPPMIFCLFTVIFYVVYAWSGFSRQNLIRYLFPMYLCLPVLLLSAFEWIRRRWRYIGMAGFILALFFGFNIQPVKADFESVRSLNDSRRRVVASAEATGRRYWRSEFWSAYLLSALSSERLIVDSYTVNRYFPYRLNGDGSDRTENLIFVKTPQNRSDYQQDRFRRLLAALGVGHKTKAFDDFWLVYEIESPVYPRALLAPIPPRLPAVEILDARVSRGFLDLTFRNCGEKEAFTPYRIHFEIPGYSSRVRDFPLQSEMVVARIPVPNQDKFTLRYYLDYCGLIIPGSRGEREYVVSPGDRVARPARLVFLSGVGPKVDVSGKPMRVCEKTVRFKLNPAPGKFRRAILHLYSPFNVKDLNWYGDFIQAVRVRLDDRLLKHAVLKNGANEISVDLEKIGTRRKDHTLTLDFQYALPVRSIPFWKAAALLDKIEFVRSRTD